jgi:glucose 1-dehydrogenase
MRALQLEFAGGRLAVADHAEPGEPSRGEVRLRLLECGVCGTDRGIAEREFGAPPLGENVLILGHEAVAMVESVGAGVVDLHPGQLVVPMVRRNCAPGCAMCKRGRRDNCLTGEYKERGIFGLHGYLCEYAIDAAADVVAVPDALAEIAALVEPASVVEKAWETARRLHPGEVERVLILGAGPIGILAAWCARASGMDVTVVSREEETSVRGRLLRANGVHYARTLDGVRADVIIEACGDASLTIAAMRALRRCGVVMVLGARPAEVQLPTLDMIIGNYILAGSVNASRAHFASAVDRLAGYDRRWLLPLLTRIGLEQAPEMLFAPPAEAVKVVHRIAQ